MVQTINYKGFGFNKHIAIIETFFDSVPGIRIERISVDSIELNIKRNFPIQACIRTCRQFKNHT